MKIAIIGTGFSGLATCWYLLNHQPISRPLNVTLIDRQGIGKGASGIAPGLLHLYSGEKAKLGWKCDLAIVETYKLLKIASKEINQPIATFSGILRIAVDKTQETYFSECVENNKDVIWLNSNECKKMVTGLPGFPGILIKSGAYINTQKYIEALWLACQRKGAIFNKKRILHLLDLKDFDTIILAAGSESNHISELKKLRLNPTKGQIIEYRWPDNIRPLPLPIVSRINIRMTHDNKACLVGSTYERDDWSLSPSIEKARLELEPKLFTLLPFLKKAPITNCLAGIRVTSPNRIPIAGHLKDNIWVLTGMGSKALIYHAWLAKKLAQAIISQNSTPIPMKAQKYLQV